MSLMGAKPKISHYLVHDETGQRYPVVEEIVIGRSSGDIIFSDDLKMSAQHCRIVRTPQGIAIQDLNSSNGTYIDGIKLKDDKIFVFKNGSSLTAGSQIFKLQEVKLCSTKPSKRKKKKSKKRGLDFSSLGLGLLLLAGLFFMSQVFITNKKTEKLVSMQMLSPYQIVEKEMKAAFEDYKELGRAREAGELTDKGLTNNIRTFLLPRLTAVHEKLQIIKPIGEFESRKLALDKKLVMALIEQLNMMAAYSETQKPEQAKEIERLGAMATAASEEIRQLEASRRPSSR